MHILETKISKSSKPPSETEKEELVKPQESRMKEIIKIKAENNG